MVIFYEKMVDGLCYQVCSVGNSCRLYIGDVFYS